MQPTKPKTQLSVLTVILSYVLFMAVWTLRVFFLNTKEMGEFTGWAVGFLVHAIWWPCFGLFFIRRYSEALPISLGEMLRTKPKWKVMVPAVAIVVVYDVIGWIVNRESYGTSMPLYDLIVTVLTVGFFEEIVFRGWFLNAIAVYTGERGGNVISAVLFALVHVPSWVKKGYPIETMLMTGLSLAVLGLFFGVIFRKSRSIWASAIVHSLWDMLSWIL